MEVQEYVDAKKQLYSLVLQFIEDDEEENGEKFTKLVDFIEKYHYAANKEELEDILSLISSIANNHYRNQHFFSNIEKLFLHLENQIKQNVSNTEIYELFKENKRILVFLFEKKIITINDEIIHSMLYKKITYFNYFYNIIESLSNDTKRIEITKKSILDSNPLILENFDEKQKKGENDSQICEIIRKDSVVDFITYVNRENISLSSTIVESVFETNLLLLSKSPTLIEYAAFFGSIQIFQYLNKNGVELNSSLWNYAIHGKNPEIIMILENEQIEPIDSSYLSCLNEAIKCHHNDIVEYIKLNFLKSDDIKFDYFNDHLYYAYQNHNYEYILTKEKDDDEDERKIETYTNLNYFYAAEFNYLELVKLLLKNKNIDINLSIICHH